MSLTDYQREVIDREAAQLHGRSNAANGHPTPYAVWPLMNGLGRWPWRALVARALGLSFTLADWPDYYTTPAAHNPE